MPTLTTAERDAFLQQRGILCRIATIDADGNPHVTPAWYLYEDGKIYMTPRLHSDWRRHIENDPRVAMTIDDAALPYNKVLLEGRATMEYGPGEDDAWRDLYRRIAQRYNTPEGAEAYIQATIDQPRALISLALADARVRTWRMPVTGEAYTGMWHDRYYEKGTKLAGEVANS